MRTTLRSSEWRCLHFRESFRHNSYPCFHDRCYRLKGWSPRNGPRGGGTVPVGGVGRHLWGMESVAEGDGCIFAIPLLLLSIFD